METAMPNATVKVVRGVFDTEEKQELARRVSETLIAFEGEGVRPYTLVTVEEVESGDWCVGGQNITTADVNALRASSPAAVS
jgi:4-oxalocrotonate tautomerase